MHSQSITTYKSCRRNNLENLLMPTFKNLKTLELNATDSKLKNISLPNIESLCVFIPYQLLLSDMSDFININGKTLKNLDVNDYENITDCGIMRKLFQSIAQSCKNLENLSTIYDDELDQELIEILNSCMKLKSITFYNGFNGDRILTVLNQTLPKRLGSIICDYKVSNINDNSLAILMKNWRGPKPLTMRFHNCGNAIKEILREYQDLGFLN